MHLITLSALRRLISGVDITPGIIRQEFFFFHFITSLAIYVHLITISHLRQFPPVVWMSLYLFISDFFSSYYTQALVRELTSGVYTSRSRSPATLWIWRGRRGVPPYYSKNVIIPNSWKARSVQPWPPRLLRRKRKDTGLPWIWPRFCQ